GKKMDTRVAVQSRNATAPAQEIAVAIIKEEHRALGTVVSALQQWVTKVAERHAEPDFALFAAAIYYIHDFPERCHHPQEDEHLFRTPRSRTRRPDRIIDDLQAEHVQSTQMIARMEHALVQYQGGAPGGLALFKGAVDEYAAMLREHMRKEEELLVEATTCLDEADWRGIATAFQANDDPLFRASPRQEFAHLYFRIVNSLPDKLRSTFRTEHRT